uniref:Uncharacterized protein n=1 Tax=viral metagenome TaxID=1070528 RepID=A0A6H1Z9L9_9ZZZZ
MPDVIGIYLQESEIHGVAYEADDGKLYVSLPERLPFDGGDDGIPHVCTGNENVLDICLAYFRGIYQDPVDKWWIVAQAQNDPVVDPLVPLRKGTILVIPSISYIEEVAGGDTLSDYPEI